MLLQLKVGSLSIGRISLLTCIFLLSTNCLWDNDTLEMERRKFPGALELITGKFIRHSQEFYKWKVIHRQKKIEAYPDSLSLYDDVAVACCKLGKMNEAIHWMRKKEKKKPGLYTTYSNIGTFYMLDGRWKEGIPWIEKALKINPNAHFGREKYQKFLAEYVLMKKKNGRTFFPLNDSGYVHSTTRHSNEISFRTFLEKKDPSDTLLVDHALRGIAGMMYFANHESPILLEVYSELLLAKGSAWLGVYALKSAAEKFPKNSNSRKEYIKKMSSAALSIPQFEGDELMRDTAFAHFELEFKTQIEEGKKYFNKIRNDENSWITLGKDPEAEFARKYYKEDSTIEIRNDLYRVVKTPKNHKTKELNSTPNTEPAKPIRGSLNIWLIVSIGTITLFLSIIFLLRRKKK